MPEPFGWKTSWMAVRTTETELLAPELGLINLRRCNWEEGLRESYGKGIFICPPAAGWTLIVGVTLPDASAQETLPVIVRLSERYGSAQYFGNHRVVDYYAWSKAERGRLVRAYAYLGERGSTLWDRGEITDEEIELEIIFDDTGTTPGSPSRQRRPQEHDVFAIAEKWSIDPTQIDQYEVSESLGILGYFET